MFVGNQRNDFLQKLRRTAGTDVYLQGALYLLESDAPQRRARLEELAAREYARTEEVLFVLSLFDDTEAGYQAMRPQLTRLLGPDRTLPLKWNFGVLEWFIRFYAEEAKRYLDSMGGAAVTSHKEQYTGAVFLVEQAAMRTAAPQKEDKSYE